MDLLPNPHKENYEDLRDNHPYWILDEYAEAICNKYEGRLRGYTNEIYNYTEPEVKNIKKYVLELHSNYSEFDLIRLNSFYLLEYYPIEISYYPNFDVVEVVNNKEELIENLNNIISLGDIQNLIIKLIQQVEISKEIKQQQNL